MPYIAIKAYPKDEKTKQEIVKRINDLFLEVWGCSQKGLSISLEEIAPENWEDQVVKAQIEPNKDKMMILAGEKLFQET
ncbi:MAG: tautomerase family protein [Oscillibacter sp.]|nr:tautomerase family protein [Oscillibacter sp.]